MDNKIKELFQNITDDELLSVVYEIKESETTGLIGSLVRKWANKSGEITGGITSTDFNMITYNILKEAAFRLINKSNQRSYTEAELLKAVEYACNMQKAEDYQMAGLSLVDDFETLDSANVSIVYVLDELSDTNDNIANKLTIEEINEHLKNG